jgi:hypothetical protein
VVKLQTEFSASGWPDESLAPVVIVAVCALLAARECEGAKVAVVPEEVTVPTTGVDPCFNMNVVVVIVEGSIAVLKVAITFVLIGVPATTKAGELDVTVGADAGGVTVGDCDRKM